MPSSPLNLTTMPFFSFVGLVLSTSWQLEWNKLSENQKVKHVKNKTFLYISGMVDGLENDIILTSMYRHDVMFIRRNVQHVRLLILRVEVLVEPLLAFLEWLCPDDVHEPRHQLRTFQKEMEMMKYDFWVPIRKNKED